MYFREFSHLLKEEEFDKTLCKKNGGLLKFLHYEYLVETYIDIVGNAFRGRVQRVGGPE
jgi:hypothetical protein